ncbi:CALRL-like protein [Mya arenaria]|uniref:CALRL-like protein n=1 Tax=Mya arenaria TaxID=6604 RepID=A0ABY7EY48_MYAAR|nr:CALRL-like protein [Mya arenaria]
MNNIRNEKNAKLKLQNRKKNCWINESALQWIIKATRATLILIPLLGLQYLLFPIRPKPGSKLQDVYHTAVALQCERTLIIQYMSIYECTYVYYLLNANVIQLLRRKWNQHKLMSRSSLRASGGPGATYTTMDPVTQTQATYFSTAENKSEIVKLPISVEFYRAKIVFIIGDDSIR